MTSISLSSRLWKLGRCAVPLVVSLAVAIVLYYPVFFMGYWAVNRSDALYLHLPNNRNLAESLRVGLPSFWNTYGNLGHPTLDGTTKILHPAVLLYVFFNPWVANSIEVILGIFLACLGMWYFLRQQKCGALPAFSGALLYVLCGPVFYLHSYHLAIMAIILLPWCLLVFHRYDRTGNPLWLWISALLCLSAVHSIDLDTLVYLFIGLTIDRLVCMPKGGLRRYLVTWTGIFFLSWLTSVLFAIPFYEWLKQSSRLSKTYTGIMNPSFINISGALLTGEWFRPWPYDAYYYYFGPAALLFFLLGLMVCKKEDYLRRYLVFSLVLPAYYLLRRLMLPFLQSTPFYSMESWRSMFVFCFALAGISAVGIRSLMKEASRLQYRLVAGAGIVTAGCFVLALLRGLSTGAMTMLVIAAAAICCIAYALAVHNRLLKVVGTLVALAATLFLPALAYLKGPGLAVSKTKGFCLRSSADITGNLPFYEELARQCRMDKENGRVAFFARVDNMAAVVGLRAIPSYAPFYNQRFEESLLSDGLIVFNKKQPYWMTLKYAPSQALAYYGVRFLLVPNTALQRWLEIPPWDIVPPEWYYDERWLLREEVTWSEYLKKVPWDIVPPEWYYGEGWIAREDLSWPEYLVFENAYYRGRAYLVNSADELRAGARFIQDRSTSVTIEVQACEGERLVLADLFYPGWKVFVDGRPARIEQFRTCLRSVRLSEGRHVVQWTYAGRAQKTSVMLFLAAMALLVGFLTTLSAKRRKEQKAEADKR